MATARRLLEELGFETAVEPLFWFTYHARWRDVGSERELCHVFVGRFDGEVRANPNEIADWRWITLPELEAEIVANGDRYSPWMKLELQRLKADHADKLP